MNGIDRLLHLFESDSLVRPRADVVNSVDLFRALAKLAGASRISGGAGVQELMELIGPTEHYVLVLVDGLGIDFIETMPQESFLRSHLAMEIRSIFPSTTASVLTSLATAHWPCAHAVPGWWIYLDNIKKTAVSLQFIERFKERPLETFGLSARDVFPLPSVWSRIRHEPLTITKSKLANSTYTKYCSGETERLGYEAIADAIDLVRKRVLNAMYPTFTYLYLAQLDSICHEKGTRHIDALNLLGTLDGQLASLCDDIGDRARTIVAADHGLVDTPVTERLVLREGDKLLNYLVCPPTVEPRVPAFHVKRRAEKHFSEGFTRRFGSHFLLITPSEAEHLKLFGPHRLSPILRRRLGTFIGIPVGAAALHYRVTGDERPPFAAVHAGLSCEEMRLPLILA